MAVPHDSQRFLQWLALVHHARDAQPVAMNGQGGRPDRHPVPGLGERQQGMREAAFHENPRFECCDAAGVIERFADLETGSQEQERETSKVGDFDVARAGWIADYKDPANFLDLCKTGAGNNYSEYSNPDYDALLKKAAASTDQVERMKALSDAEAIGVARDLCVLPLLYYSYHDIVSNKVKGWEENVMDVHPTRYMSKE